MTPSPDSALFTDLYQLTMLQGYFTHRMEATAVFEFFVRKLPPTRNFLVAAGLEQVLQFLEQLQFSDSELSWLAQSGSFDARFLEWLRSFRFRGDVNAMPEGTVFFPHEPVLQVIARLPEAQLIESRLINLLQFQTLIASKAARCVLAAPGKRLVDFGMRRAHGGEAGLLAARASYLAGFDGTATVQAGLAFGIPVYGTMAHSFIQAHDDEANAFARFATANPNDVVLLIDTYDTEAAAQKVVQLSSRLKAQGIAIKGVRLDSGDLAVHAANVRRILDAAGLTDVTIFASGSLDEHRIANLLAANAPIDGFGIGSRLDASADAPYLDCAYKLEEYAGHARRKRSEGKATWPGRKQVWRELRDGKMVTDLVGLNHEEHATELLLKPAFRDGQRTAPPESLERIRDRVRSQLAALPQRLSTLDPAQPYSVTFSEPLRKLAQQLDQQSSDATG